MPNAWNDATARMQQRWPKTRKNKNLCIISLVAMSRLTSISSPHLYHFCYQFWVTSSLPTLMTSFFNGRNFRKELHTRILLFRLFQFFGVHYASFCSSYFLPKSIFSLKVSKWKVLLEFFISSQTGAEPTLLYKNTLLRMADFNWLVSYG